MKNKDNLKEMDNDDKNSRVALMNYNPFDDAKIIQKGLSILKNKGYKLRSKVDSVGVRIKGFWYHV